MQLFRKSNLPEDLGVKGGLSGGPETDRQKMGRTGGPETDRQKTERTGRTETDSERRGALADRRRIDKRWGTGGRATN
ncbi:hypothetical protein PACILC2_08440 [Paenibacillus cisolokensis]|uniref:Uncharacterized protein n=1 Tax=Paenibacillus cisolokensis TaxID=1658519 RepID=A0ABQ4N276_9BACL|nr:hypothetical protein PACILC2_08440 [Paenibacillus cisolokensis]